MFFGRKSHRSFSSSLRLQERKREMKDEQEERLMSDFESGPTWSERGRKRKEIEMRKDVSQGGNEKKNSSSTTTIELSQERVIS